MCGKCLFFRFQRTPFFSPQQKPNIFVSVLALDTFQRGRVALTQNFERQQSEFAIVFVRGPASESMCDFFSIFEFFAQEVKRVVTLCCTHDFHCTSIRKEFVLTCSMCLSFVLQLLAEFPCAFS